MSDEAILLCLLVILYLVECAHWLPTHCFAFVATSQGSFKLRAPQKFLGNETGGLVLLNPLPPFGFWLRAWQFPVSLSPEVVYAYVATAPGQRERPRQSAQFVRFQDVRTVVANGDELLINGIVAVKSTSPVMAVNLATTIRHLQGLPVAKRAAVIRKFVTVAFDADAVRSRVELAMRDTCVLRWLCHVQAAFLFFVAPALLLVHFSKAQLIVLGVLYALIITVLVILLARLRGRYFSGRTGEFCKTLLVAVVYPPSTPRVVDAVGYRLVESFHPLAVAAAVSPPATFTALAREHILDLKHPMLPVCPATDEEAVATEAWFRNCQLEVVSEFLRARKVDPTQFDAPPQPLNADCLSYCPHCHHQFEIAVGTCADCGGLPLKCLP